jgi:hypothetical protein
MIKEVLLGALRRTGYDLAKSKAKPRLVLTPDEETNYLRWYGDDADKNRRSYNVGAGKFSHPFGPISITPINGIVGLKTAILSTTWSPTSLFQLKLPPRLSSTPRILSSMCPIALPLSFFEKRSVACAPMEFSEQQRLIVVLTTKLGAVPTISSYFGQRKTAKRTDGGSSKVHVRPTFRRDRFSSPNSPLICAPPAFSALTIDYLMTNWKPCSKRRGSMWR